MSFGTGHHATTYMMIEMMREIDHTGKKVLDFGTGTGILAILAEKLSAADILAIDIDDQSIENAFENIEENHCSRITLVKAGAIPGKERLDIILANLTKIVLLTNMAEIEQHLDSQGVFVMSGLLPDDRIDNENEAKKNDLRIVDQLERNGWMALKLLRH